MNKASKVSVALSSMMALTLLVSGCGANAASSASGASKTSGSGTNITFLQNKREAVGTYNELIKKFEKANPGITVTQVNPPDADTVLKTDLTKNKLPDVIAMGGDSTFHDLAQADVLMDFSGTPEVKKVTPMFVTMLNNLTQTKETYGVPYTASAQTVLYNKDLFKKYGISIPATWNQFIAAAEKIKKAGANPFYFTVKDNWTTMIPWNAMASNLQGANFFKNLDAGKTSFAKSGDQTVADHMLQLYAFAQPGAFGTTYDQGNQAFAQGKSVMYTQGNWAIPAIKSYNPKINIGSFAFPSTTSAGTNRLAAGVDSVLAVSDNSSNKDAAKKFIDFLLQQPNAQTFVNEQKTLPALNGVTQKDPSVADIAKYFATNRLADVPDHYYPAAMQFPNLVQEFLMKKDKKTFLAKLDTEYQKAKSHE